MKKILIMLLSIALLTSCTSKSDSSNTTEDTDDDGYYTTTFTNNLAMKWKVTNDTHLDGVLIGDPGDTGWIAVGFGKSNMSGAKIIVAQHGADNTTSVGNATGYNYGLLSNSSTILNSSNISVNGTVITATFNITLASANISLNESTNVIWAYLSDDEDTQSNLSNINKHESRGTTTITFE